MRILIGTPIHSCKDYCLERWLENVSKLLKESPADFLLVDNSAGLDYVKKVTGYLKKYQITNFQIKHLNLNQGMSLLEKCHRIEAAQKFIRQYVISQGYDGWFSWECDQIIPPDSLNKLTQLMATGNFMVIAHNSWTRGSSLFNMDMGVTLIKKAALKKHHWQGEGEEVLFKERVFREGGNYANVYGLLKPVEHLDDRHYLDDEL